MGPVERGVDQSGIAYRQDEDEQDDSQSSSTEHGVQNITVSAASRADSPRRTG